MQRIRSIFRVLLMVSLVCPIPLWANDCQTARQRYDDAVATADYQQKVILYQQAVALCPTYAEAYNNLADAYERVGRDEDAIAAYQKAVTLRPDLAVAHFGLGDIYLRMGLFSQAATAYEAGLRLQPNDRLARTGLQRARRGVPSTEANTLMDAATIVRNLQDAPLPTMGVRGVRQSQSRLRFHNILFDYDSAQLRTEAFPQLKELGKALATPDLEGRTLVIEGHTDSQGDAAYNERLALKRAEAVKAFLVVQADLDESSIHIRSFGEQRPIADNRTEAGRQRNRRVEIVAIHPDTLGRTQ